MDPSLILIVVPLVLFAVGIALVWFGRKTRLRARASASWPQTTGTITGVNIETRHRSKGGTRYIPRVFYSYEVGGQTFTGDRLRFADLERTSAERAGSDLAPYAVGARVPVFFDPAATSESTLSTSATGTLQLELMGYAFLAISTAVGILANMV